MDRLRLKTVVTATILSFLNEINVNDDDDSSDEESPCDQEFGLFVLQKGDKPVRMLGYVAHVLNLNCREFQAHFRVPFDAFEYLLAEISPLIMKSHGKPSPPNVPPNVQLLAVLWLLATPDSYRSVGERFDLSKSTLATCFVRVVKALCEVAPRHIKWPERDKIETIKRKIHLGSRIPHAIGAIDGCYIPIKAPKENAECYINRKCFHAITLQAICDPFLQFTNCFVGYPSSVSDVRIFRNSHIYEDVTNEVEMFFPNGEYILGDKAYPSLPWLLAPYINRGNLTQKKVYFNTHHAKARQIIERAFALLKGRFRRLKYLDMNRTDLIPATVLAACVLHNICINFNDSFIQQYVAEGQEVEEGQEQERYAGGVDQNGILKRDFIANQLWNDR